MNAGAGSLAAEPALWATVSAASADSQLLAHQKYFEGPKMLFLLVHDGLWHQHLEDPGDSNVYQDFGTLRITLYSIFIITLDKFNVKVYF